MIGGQSYFMGENGREDVSESFNGKIVTLGELRSDIRGNGASFAGNRYGEF